MYCHHSVVFSFCLCWRGKNPGPGKWRTFSTTLSAYA